MNRIIRPRGFKLNPGQIPADALFANPLLRHICLVGGTRSGKTFFIVRAIMTRAIRGEGSRHAVLRAHANAAKKTISMDTLPMVNRLCFPQHHFIEHRGDGFWEGPNGSQIWVGGLDDKKRVEKILGSEFVSVYLNECSQISYSNASIARTRLAQVVPGLIQRMYYDLNPVGKTHWTNKLFGLKVDPESDKPLAHPEQYDRLFLNPEHNAENLSEAQLDELRNEANTRHRKRFYEGVYVDEVEGALITYEQIERARCTEEDLPELSQTIVAIDPSGTMEKSRDTDVDIKPKNDETGIIVASLGVDGRVYLRKDLSMVAGPEAWGKAAVSAYHYFKADRIIVEVNYGGGMAINVIKSIDPNIPVKALRAAPGQGKHVRAEPVATLYQRKDANGEPNPGVYHVGRYPELEDQLCAFTTMAYGGPKSPDRADAWIWAVTDLAIQTNGAEGWIEYYRRLSEEANGAPVKPGFGYEIGAPNPDKKYRVRVPEGITHVYLSDGQPLLVPADRIVSVSKEDASALGRRGWERLDI